MNQSIIGEHIEKKRANMGKSQSEMASLLGLSLSTYKRIVTGETSKLDDALHFALNYRMATGSSLMEAFSSPTRQHKMLYKLNELTPSQLDVVEKIVDEFLKR